MLKTRTPFLASTLALTFTAALFTAATPSGVAAPPFHIASLWKLGGDGSWDYLAIDRVPHLLYIARLNRFMVIDTQTGKVVTEIGGLQHAHGVAFDDTGKVGFISDGGAGEVVVFDRTTWKKAAAIQVGKNPDSILFEPTRKLVFVFNGGSRTANVIDAASLKVIATIPLPGKPEFSVTDGAGNIFVNIEDTSHVLHIDASSLKVIDSWSLAPCKEPSGLAIDVAHHRLFSVCDNDRMAIVDTGSGKVVAAPTIGSGADAVAYDAGRKLVFSSNGESGNMTVLRQTSPDGYSTVQTLPTKVGARTMAVDPSDGSVYTVTAKLGPKPAVTASVPKPKPSIAPNTFVVLVIR